MRSNGTRNWLRDSHMTKREAIILGVLLVVLVAVFLLSLALGSTAIPVRRVLEALTGISPERDATVIIVERIAVPRARSPPCWEVHRWASPGGGGRLASTIHPRLRSRWGSRPARASAWRWS